MISAGSVSSPMSIADLRKRGGSVNGSSRRTCCNGGLHHRQELTESQRPLSEYVRFETKEGMALLFHPSPLDKWIGQNYKWDSKHQHHVDPSTGRILSPEESEDYRRYGGSSRQAGQVGWQMQPGVGRRAQNLHRQIPGGNSHLACPWKASL